MWVCLQEKRDVSRSMKYVELLMVADHAEVKAQAGAKTINESNALIFDALQSQLYLTPVSRGQKYEICSYFGCVQIQHSISVIHHSGGKKKGGILSP